jgi:hypothetical protein
MSMRLGKLPNPYDFANPVSDTELLAGRTEELNEIEYYLEHATAHRPIHLAFIGARASGKTSLLNVTESKAREKGFCAVRIDLDETDVDGQLPFFFKLFDSVLSAACLIGAYGGVEGRTYETYLDAVNTFAVPESKLFSPFLFPHQYARAMQSGNHLMAQVAEQTFRRDLQLISGEVGKPIVILIDEGDILAESRPHLQKLRNLLMHLSGYMLILAGTPGLFPAMNEVFSPIGRQFKKITIGQFQRERDTFRCISGPLVKYGLPLSQVSSLLPRTSAGEIHRLSSGRPYEIQLICHIAFRRIQAGKTRRIQLDLDLIEEVLREIGSAQDTSLRPLISRVRGLSLRQLSALGIFTRSDSRATLSELRALELVSSDNSDWTEGELAEALESFQKLGLLSIEQDVVRFSGDDFDRIYIKYYAREKGVVLEFSDLPISVLWERHFVRMIRQEVSHLRLRWLDNDWMVELGEGVSKVSVERLDQFDVLNLLSNLMPMDSQMFTSRQEIITEDSQEHSFPAVRIAASLPSINLILWPIPSGKESIDAIEEIEAGARRVVARLGKIGGASVVEKYRVFPMSLSDLQQRVAGFDGSIGENAQELFRLTVLRITAETYMSDVVAATKLLQKFKGELLELPVKAPAFYWIWNTLGYLAMASGDLTLAHSALTRCTTEGSTPVDPNSVTHLSLGFYNLALVEARLGNMGETQAGLDSALSVLDDSADELGSLDAAPDSEQPNLTLQKPVIEQGMLRFEEIRNVSELRPVIQEAKRILAEFSDPE